MTHRFKIFGALALLLTLPVLALGISQCQAMTQGMAVNTEKDSSAVTVAQDTVEFPQDTIQILQQNGERLNFNVELAVTPKQHAQGLMFRRELADNAGMLFIFDNNYVRSFWMKNTFIPLDILFLHADGRIHHIHHNARPQDLTSITSKLPSTAVLEIPGGLSDRIGIAEGDQILHPAFKNVTE